jgi:two-component system, NarL family, nitrate/nitrite response regulator NarL
MGSDVCREMTRLLIVAEVRLYREGLARLLGREFEIAGTAGTAEEGVIQSAALEPDVALFGASEMVGPSVVARVDRASPRTRVVVIAASSQEADIVAWAETGVAGYVTQEQTLTDLRDTLRGIHRGETICSPLVSRALMRRVAAIGAVPSLQPHAGRVLTQRESEILELIERGLSNKEIAARLTIELATVKNHVHNVLAKLGVKRRMDAVVQMRPAAVGGTRDQLPNDEQSAPLAYVETAYAAKDGNGVVSA